LLVLASMLTGCRLPWGVERQQATDAVSETSQSNEIKVQGLQHLEAGNYNDAYVLLREAATVLVDDYEVAWGLARTNSKLGDDIETLDWVNRALELAPDSTEASELKGRTLLRLARFREAIEVLDGVVRAHPDYLVAWLNLSAAYNAIDDMEKAVEAARSATKHSPDSPAAFFALGDLYLQQNRLADGEQQYHIAIEKDPDHALSYLRLASVYIRRNQDLDQARSWAIKSDELDSGDGSAASTAAWVLFLQDRKVEAAKEMAKTAEAHPQNYQIWLRLGRILEDLGDKEKAQEAFDTGVRFAPRGAIGERSVGRQNTDLGAQ
jgi:tetratricopeptide (TPR) repeat protein